MRIIYRALTLLLVALAAIQTAALAWFMGGAITWTDAGGTLTDDLMWGDAPPFAGVHGLTVHWFVGSILVPAVALAVAVVAALWRNELAIVASLALVGLAVVQAMILTGIVVGPATPALQGAIIVVIAAVAAVAPKGAAWADANREKVKLAFGTTPLPA
ncbi:hypothetical protein [Demequina soli]|uniref:hypothetical protein n=1 Tax=Demequina soli TaxID=1638987 RepID=UPI000780B415|nr:hypothetical protein [Demequina soli]